VDISEKLMKSATRTSRLLTRSVALAAAGLMVAACSVQDLIEGGLSRVEGVGEVDIDFSEEGGSFNITSEEGEAFGVDVDDEGTSTIHTDEGSMTTTLDGEVPSEVTDAIDLPAGFTAQSVSRMEDAENGNAIMVQGTIQGAFGDLLDELEAAVSSHWSQVERMTMAEGQMGAVIGTDDAEEHGVHATLIMENDGTDEGMLQIMVIDP